MKNDGKTENVRTRKSGVMTVPRYMHNSIRMADGRVLVVCGTLSGGFQRLRTAEIYDPKTDSFEVCKGPQIQVNWKFRKEVMRERIAASGICEMPMTGGRFYFIAGFGRPEVYDLKKDRFLPVKSDPGNPEIFPMGWNNL